MYVTRTSPLSGKTNTLDLPCTPDDMVRWHKGMPVQDAFPMLTDEQREFIISGLTPGEFEEMFRAVG